MRERLSIPAAELEAALAVLRPAVRESFIISTCNRTEVYGVMGHATSGADALVRFLAERGGVQAARIRDACYVHSDADAVRHALRVASGLDSMVLGEDQIQGQLKRALAAAREAGTLGPILDRLGTSALACGKRVRTFTGLGRHAVSLESLAVRAVVERLGRAEGRTFVVVGAGESASLVARHLRELRGAHLRIVSRSFARAEALALSIGAEARRLSDLAQLLADADAAFACTSSPTPVLTRGHVERRRETRRADPLVCVDLGVPRDIDDAVASIPGVSVLRLDELAQLAESHRAERREHVPAAEAIVSDESRRFAAWLDARGVARTITQLSAHADAIADAEIERALSRLRSVDPQQREVIADLAHRIIRKLLHRPIHAMKHHPEADNMAIVLETLFGLPGGADSLEQSSQTVREPALTQVS